MMNYEPWIPNMASLGTYTSPVITAGTALSLPGTLNPAGMCPLNAWRTIVLDPVFGLTTLMKILLSQTSFLNL